jgi:hypothetical protein
MPNVFNVRKAVKQLIWTRMLIAKLLLRLKLSGRQPPVKSGGAGGTPVFSMYNLR